MQHIPSQIKTLLEKPVGIFGFGVSGKGAAKLLSHFNIPYSIYDKKEDTDVETEFSSLNAKKHKLIIASPGFVKNHPWIILAKENNCTVLGELDFAAAFFNGKIIAITGTNGKTTLTKFLTDVLKNAGHLAFSCGNIGNPLSQFTEYLFSKEAIAVCEVSSAQSEHLEYFNPDSLLWTNFDEDHLDRYNTLEEYFKAKWNLVLGLKKPSLFIGESVAQAARAYEISIPSYAKVIPTNISQTNLNPPPAGSHFARLPQLENYLLAAAYWKSKGLDSQILQDTASSFKLPPHRLQKIAQIENISFWDDSKATNFAAAIAGLKRFEKPVYWIGGGYSKGGDIKNFCTQIAPFIKHAYLIGATANTISYLLINFNIKCEIHSSLDEAVYSAWDTAKKEAPEAIDLVLSPGFASFDMFKNYEHRGFSFKKCVLELKTHSKTLENI